jgi:hypothetical protein
VKLTGRFLFLPAALFAGSAAHGAVDFKREILPLLENRCLKCHSAAHEENGKLLKPEGDLRLDAAWALLDGNKDVIPVRPGDVANSGIAGGQVYGKTDNEGREVIENKITIPDFNATMAYALGLPLDQIVFSPSMRPFTVCDKGQPITSLFG